MNIKQQHQSTLDIDYVRGESLTLKVSDLEQENIKQHQLWTIVTAILVLIFFLLFSTFFNFFLENWYWGILFLTGLFPIAYAAKKVMSSQSETSYTFDKMEFIPTAIIINNTQEIELKPPFLIDLILSQGSNRPSIELRNNDNFLVHFQLDSLHDFPIVTDAIAAVYGLEFKEHTDINEFTEKLTFSTP